MEQFFYNSLIQYIMMYYKSALVFSITVCCLNVLAGKLYVFYETKNTPVLFFFAIYIFMLCLPSLSYHGPAYTFLKSICAHSQIFIKPSGKRRFFIQISYCSSQCPSFCIPSIQRSAIFLNAYCLVL